MSGVLLRALSPFAPIMNPLTNKTGARVMPPNTKLPKAIPPPPVAIEPPPNHARAALVSVQ
jgi:hypothetical protein